MSIHVELCPGHPRPPVLPGPELPLLLLLPSTFLAEVKTVDWLPITVFVPENNQNLTRVGMLELLGETSLKHTNLVSGNTGSDVAGEVGHHAQHRLH